MKGERKKRILIVSLSNLARDPRVFRQIEALRPDYIVHSAGKEPSGLEDEFFLLFSELSRPTRMSSILAAAKGGFLLHRIASAIVDKLGNRVTIPFAVKEILLRTDPNVRRFLRAARRYSYDLVIANDITSIAQSFWARGGAKLLYDAHEYSLDQFESAHRRDFGVYRKRLLDKYLRQADGVVTVSSGIARKYHDEFGIRMPEVITSAATYRELAPKETNPRRIRLVHHGVAARLRMIEEMISAFERLDDRFELDLYLVTANKRYYSDLVDAYSSNPRLRFREPVPMQEIPEMLNDYDVGLAMFAPRTVNLRYVLPNKFFEYIQGRIAVCIGPSVEMASYVNRYRLGVTTEDFTAESMAKALSALTAEEIMEFKSNANRHALELSSIPQMEKLRGIVGSLIGSGR
jgi:glycosyltransferase involved in cell wall biosynthesis